MSERVNNQEELINIDRALYKKIKGFNKDQMSSFLTDLYVRAEEEALKKIQTASIDLDELRNEISQIKGIGENRLNEIMTIIESKLSEKTDETLDQ